MAINQLSTANTFEEWLTTTSSLVAVANNLTDNTNGGFVANSSIFIQGSNASLNVRTHANINTLQANTANITNISFSTANITGNVESLNVTNRLFVGGDTFVYGNLTISGNTTLDAIGFNDLNVAGSITANSANISILTGAANTAIYAAISSTADLPIAYAIALG